MIDMNYSSEIAGFVGQKHRYSVKNRRPLAFGGTSVLWVCDDENTNQEVIIKAFRELLTFTKVD